MKRNINLKFRFKQEVMSTPLKYLMPFLLLTFSFFLSAFFLSFLQLFFFHSFFLFLFSSSFFLSFVQLTIRVSSHTRLFPKKVCYLNTFLI